MRKSIYLSLVLICLPLIWSCSKDNDDEDNTIIPSGWVKNDDLALLGKNSWYLYRSGNDSIRLNLSYYSLTYDYGHLTYFLYKKNNQGEYNFIEIANLDKAYSIEKNGEKQIFGQGLKDKDYGVNYKLIDNNTVEIYNLPKLNPFEGGLIFKAVRDDKYNDKNRLAGGWYHSEVVDSTVLIFEEKNIKEYLFVRGSSTIQNSWDYGDYTATRTLSYLQEEYLGAKASMVLREDYSEHEYSIYNDGNYLTIYWESPGKTTTYKRIKN